jgi:uncharacterized membrane protein
MNAILGSGRFIYALAIAGLGIETLVCAHSVDHSLGQAYNVIPVLPWLPSIPWLAYLFGVVWIICALGLLVARTQRTAALALGSLLFLFAITLVAPKYTVSLGNISLRTVLLEPLSLASYAFLLLDPATIPAALTRASRYVLGLCLIVFGVDHFLALAFIATLLPSWIPWHVFWVAFFGAAMIASGLSIALSVLTRWGAGGVGLMFGLWVVTLHLPRVLGLYGVPGATRNPNEWSSLLIAIGMWGGSWALARLAR